MSKFPVTADDEPVPSHPKDEPTREEVNRHPEDLVARVLRTRRYFRLARKAGQRRYAVGMESKPEDMA